jgi:hypothetical protein
LAGLCGDRQQASRHPRIFLRLGELAQHCRRSLLRRA